MTKIIDVESVVDGPVKPKKRASKKSISRVKKTTPAEKASPTAKRKKQSKKGEVVLCHWNGRFGNRMHQYAYGATYAKKFKLDFVLPGEWEGTRLFKNQYHIVSDDDELRLYLNQTQKEFDNLDSRSRAMQAYGARKNKEYVYVNPDNPKEVYAGKTHVYYDSVCAYSKNIFEGQSQKFLKKVFEFNQHVKNLDDYKKFEDIQGTYDVAHLRRDDVSNAEYNRVNIQGYSVLSKKSYERAFKRFDVDPAGVQWISDDYSRKWHNDREDRARGGWKYPEGSSYMGPDVVFDWLHDFFKMYFARNVFRANSSFSWWAGFLSPVAQFYSPVVNKQHIYGRDNDGEEKEIDLKFVKGNQPHWMHNQPDIIIKP
jgi:hypothetical protein